MTREKFDAAAGKIAWVAAEKYYSNSGCVDAYRRYRGAKVSALTLYVDIEGQKLAR